LKEITWKFKLKFVEPLTAETSVLKAVFETFLQEPLRAKIAETLLVP